VLFRDSASEINIELLNHSDAGLWGLFISAFISSTLMPGGSEALLLWMAANSPYSPISLLSTATLGNTLGGMTNWLIGYAMVSLIFKQPSANTSMQKALGVLQKYGSPALLFSWLPIIGDPLCLAAGYLRCNPWLSALFILIGKAARYATLLWLENIWLS